MTLVLIALSLYAMTWIVLAITEPRLGRTGPIGADITASASVRDVEMVRKAA